MIDDVISHKHAHTQTEREKERERERESFDKTRRFGLIFCLVMQPDVRLVVWLEERSVQWCTS